MPKLNQFFAQKCILYTTRHTEFVRLASDARQIAPIDRNRGRYRSIRRLNCSLEEHRGEKMAPAGFVSTLE